MKLRNILFSLALTLSAAIGGYETAKAQSVNPFNPDYAWCAVQGSVATRGATTWNCLTPGTAGQVLRTNGAGANVSWQTVTGTGTVTSVGMTVPAFMTVTGSPITTTGTLATSFNSQSANLFLASPNGSAGVPSFRGLALADIPTMDAAHLPNAGVVTGGVITGTFPALTIGSAQVTGAMIASTTINSGNIGNSQINNGKLAVMADSTIKSNISGASANPSDNTITAILDKQLGSTQGTVAYRDASSWAGLAPSAGNILQSNGAGANPSWVAPSAAIPAAVGIGHRITGVSGQPVNTVVSGGTTIYSTPYLSDLLLLWNGTNFVPTHCAETSQLLSDATKSPAAAVASNVYDLFAWNDAGTCRVTRGPPWTAGTGGSITQRGTGAGSTAIARTNFGILTNVNAITNGPGANAGTYMGTIITNSSALLDFSLSTVGASCVQAKVALWNMYNRVNSSAIVRNSTASITSTSTGGFWGGFGACSVQLARGLDDDAVMANIVDLASAASTGFAGLYISLDSAITASIDSITAVAPGGGVNSTIEAEYLGLPGLGAHTLNAGIITDGTNLATYFGNGRFALRVQMPY